MKLLKWHEVLRQLLWLMPIMPFAGMMILAEKSQDWEWAHWLVERAERIDYEARRRQYNAEHPEDRQ